MIQISNYKELVAERIRLEQSLQNQKAILKSEMNLVKAKFEPFADFAAFLGLFKRTNVNASSLLQKGISVGIDLIVRDNLLSRTNWVVRTVLPAFLKGISKLLAKKKVALSEVKYTSQEVEKHAVNSSLQNDTTQR